MEGKRRDLHRRGVAWRIMGATLMAGALTACGWALAGAPDAVLAGGQSVTVSVDCDASGDLVGQITGVPGPYPASFDVFVTDHIPGQGFFVEIPGSRVGVMANSSSVNYGPLDTSQHRAGINTMRVETTLSDAKSLSLLCGNGQTATPAVSSTPGVTKTAGTTHTPPAQTPTVGVSTSTPTPVPTSTNVPGTATSVATNIQGTSTAGASANPSSVPTFVNTVLASQSTDNAPPPAGIALPATGHGPGGASNQLEQIAGLVGLVSACAFAWAIRRAMIAS